MCLARIAGKLGMTTDAAPFTPVERADWNRDTAILRHEIGHALVWFFHGGGIGRLRCTRAFDGLLEASVQFGPPCFDWQATPEFIDACAERLLAGEVVARRHLGLPGGRIALRGLRGSRLPMGIRPREIAETMTENPIGPDGRRMLEDITKVLLAAEEHHVATWRAWIQERLLATEAIVTEHAACIEVVAAQLLHRLPSRPGRQFVLPAAKVVDLLAKAGVRFHASAPVILLS